jgi:cytochrome c biogenesis protein CcmG, thiol:disulfide interchange protein DsbE
MTFGMLALFGVIGAGAVLFALRGGDSDEAPGETVEVRIGVLDPFRPEDGGPAPDFALVDARDGKTVHRLSDYRGKVVVVNWYASWCGPCRAEIPDFQEAQDALGDEVVFLLINLQEDQAVAAGFLEDLDATLLAVLDSEGKVAEHYRVRGMPTTFFIDREGNVSISGSGLVTRTALETELAKLGLEF